MSIALGIADTSPASSDQESWEGGVSQSELGFGQSLVFGSKELILHAKTDLVDKTKRWIRSQSTRLNSQPLKLTHLAGNLVNRDTYFREQDGIETARNKGLEIWNRHSEIPETKPQNLVEWAIPNIIPKTSIPTSQLE